ncbi:hypothetical protein AB1Y20_012091 [Prymnesium parvum]|uniref:Phosphatidylinositol-specific phospholipase C X domain-containing protein n=1 Tax=Prymnesium parvum TaxID=97485 RepID=A0AB34IPL4_PRYPA
MRCLAIFFSACALVRASVGSLAWVKAHDGKEATVPSFSASNPAAWLLTGASDMLKEGSKNKKLLGMKAATDRPLNEHAMIMAHDAATTYLSGGILHPVNNWAKTQQDGGFRGMLDCGARAFDWRSQLDGGELVFHHGKVVVPHSLPSALDEVVEWANANARNASDLVLIHATFCAGTGCDEALSAAFAARNVAYITQCSELQGLTVAEAAARGKLPGGGYVLAVKDCLVSHYQPDVACSGYISETAVNGTFAAAEQQVVESSLPSFYNCHASSSSRDFPLNRMWSYLSDVSKAGPPADGLLYSHQALWQETDASVAVGVALFSSLLDDEKRSTLNSLLEQRVTQKKWDVTRANLIEVNNVCDGGTALLAALRKAQLS